MKIYLKITDCLFMKKKHFILCFLFSIPAFSISQYYNIRDVDSAFYYPYKAFQLSFPRNILLDSVLEIDTLQGEPIYYVTTFSYNEDKQVSRMKKERKSDSLNWSEINIEYNEGKILWLQENFYRNTNLVRINVYSYSYLENGNVALLHNQYIRTYVDTIFVMLESKVKSVELKYNNKGLLKLYSETLYEDTLAFETNIVSYAYNENNQNVFKLKETKFLSGNLFAGYDTIYSYTKYYIDYVAFENGQYEERVNIVNPEDYSFNFSIDTLITQERSYLKNTDTTYLSVLYDKYGNVVEKYIYENNVKVYEEKYELHYKDSFLITRNYIFFKKDSENYTRDIYGNIMTKCLNETVVEEYYFSQKVEFEFEIKSAHEICIAFSEPINKNQSIEELFVIEGKGDEGFTNPSIENVYVLSEDSSKIIIVLNRDITGTDFFRIKSSQDILFVNNGERPLFIDCIPDYEIAIKPNIASLSYCFVNGVLFVHSEISISKISIITITGEMIAQQGFLYAKNVSFDLYDMPTGVYIAYVEKCDGSIESVQFIVE